MSTPSAPSRPSRVPLLKSMAVGAALGMLPSLLCLGIIGPWTGEGWLTYVLHGGSFVLAGLATGVIQRYPELVALGFTEAALAISALVLAYPWDGWIVIWLVWFCGSGLLWAPIVGLLYRHFRDGVLGSSSEMEHA